jgi:hypothetical protein
MYCAPRQSQQGLDPSDGQCPQTRSQSPATSSPAPILVATLSCRSVAFWTCRDNPKCGLVGYRCMTGPILHCLSGQSPDHNCQLVSVEMALTLLILTHNLSRVGGGALTSPLDGYTAWLISHDDGGQNITGMVGFASQVLSCRISATPQDPSFHSRDGVLISISEH